MQHSRLTRRSVLGLVGFGLAAAGCHHTTHRSARHVGDPDRAAMLEAHLDEQTLIAAYDHALATAPGHRQARLNVERAVHATHLAALAGYVPTSSSTGNPPVIPLSKLPLVLRSSAARKRRAALAAVDGRNAALLASIAASHEVGARG